MSAILATKPVFSKKFMPQKNKLKFGIPAGSLEKSMMVLFKDAGYNLEVVEKPFSAYLDDPEIDCFFDKANQIGFLIGQEILDAGIVSRAALRESKAKVIEVCEIGTPNSEWSATKVVLAVPE